MTEQPQNFLQLTVDSVAKEAIPIGVGIVCAAGYYAWANAQKDEQALAKDALTRNTTLVYAAATLTTRAVRLLFSMKES